MASNVSLTRPAHIPPEQWERALDDLETYRRELPRLLKDGHANRYALIKSGQVVSVWDTEGDALQAANERFGAEPVATYKINPLDVARFSHVRAIGKEQQCPS
ncbi:MAG: hypothetical protein FJ271_10290 [Planctomycetes bacterium]|nr:hypothetical protein [Planctomycetota bacterium]